MAGAVPGTELAPKQKGIDRAVKSDYVVIDGMKDRRLSLSTAPKGYIILAIRELGYYSDAPMAAISIERKALDAALQQLTDWETNHAVAETMRLMDNPAPMSFPTEGWTLTLDMAAGAAGLPELLSRVDHMVLDAGGRHYLAKDSHVSPNTVRRGYPRLGEWQEIRSEMDPSGTWRSDLARRLGLVEGGNVE